MDRLSGSKATTPACSGENMRLSNRKHSTGGGRSTGSPEQKVAVDSQSPKLMRSCRFLIYKVEGCYHFHFSGPA
ncbi:unnamed protein product [Nyctereutes procyonoides]|uniref:(raccoon dog) hypothetical protein n=1 Tax=Nyctereutes procyonoides TaxID=34880 RepID=A0A811XU07_NYCPR|nr:unnamed protein product [Nyctereutes procyonoides]